MLFDKTIFKDYDIRGEYPSSINPEIFEDIAKELSSYYHPKIVCVGRDNRTSSTSLAKAMIEGFLKSGVNVIDAGLISTDMIYFLGGKFKFDLNIVITGSHVVGQNGFKICKKNAIPISGQTGLYKIRDRLLKRKKFLNKNKKKGTLIKKDFTQEWISHALSFIDLKKIKKFKIVFDTGNGVSGPIIKKLQDKIPGKFFNLFFELDGNFPNHFPNPLNEENLKDIKKKIIKEKADFGVAFDADGDRAFFLDEKGKTISGSIITAIISKNILQKNKGAKILYNAVCGRIVPQTIEKYGGIPIRVRVGHSIIKEMMRKHKALFAGEHSGHFYFKDNYFSDSGLIAFLKVLELFSCEDREISEIIKEFDIYSSSGEINFKVDDKKKVIKKIEREFKNRSIKIDWVDGISVWFKDWWFNVRPSNTESLLRLNVEADNFEILNNNLPKIIKFIEDEGGQKVIH